MSNCHQEYSVQLPDREKRKMIGAVGGSEGGKEKGREGGREKGREGKRESQREGRTSE